MSPAKGRLFSLGLSELKDSDISKIITTDTTKLIHEGEIWSVFYGYKLKFMFCTNHCRTV